MDTLNDDIILRYLTGTATESEIACVETWSNESPENEKTLEQLYFTLQASDKLRVMNSVDPEMALLRFKTQIRQKSKTIRFRQRIRWIQQAAAVLFIPLLLLSAYLFIQKDEIRRQYVEVRTNPGMVSSFSLPDGSKVWLNAGGTLRYPNTFTAQNRVVELQGQAYFEVTKNPSVPFLVKTSRNYSVEVLGTSFNVSAYKDDNLIETTLVRGSVRLNINQSNGKIIHQLLRPDEKATYSKDDNRMIISTVNPDCDIAWKDGKIIFKNKPMDEVLKILSRHYNVRFNIKDKRVLNSVITAKFENEQLSQVLEYIKLASGTTFKINKPSVIENDTLKISVIEVSK